MNELSVCGSTDSVGICDGIIETIVTKSRRYSDSIAINIVRRSDDIGVDNGTVVDAPCNT